MTAAFLPEFRGSPQATCDHCGNHQGLQQAKVGSKTKTLCKTCRAAFDAEPVWVDDRNYQVPRHNQDISDV